MNTDTDPNLYPSPLTHQAFAGLGEADKKVLFGWVFNQMPDIVQPLLQMAGVGRGGFRPKVIVQRPSHVAARIDSALLDPRNSPMLNTIAMEFVRRC